MNLSLVGSRVIVAGGSSGIGLAVARLFLAEGARVSLIARDEGRLLEAEAELKSGLSDGASETPELLPIVADVTQPEEVNRVVDAVSEAWGGVDSLVDAVGKGHRGLLRDLTAGEWEENWRLNVLSAALLAQATAGLMARQGGGQMVFLGAASGKQPTEGQLASNVHKAGLMAFVTTLATELAADGIRVNLVCPGRSLSERRLVKARQVSEEQGVTIEQYFDELSKSIPLGRLGEPEEVAALAVFLCSQRAGYITGQSICVDGGLVRSI